jgi:hypothetical protein
MLGLSLLAMPACAQVKFGDGVTVGLTGDLGVGYNADNGNTSGSDHSIGLNGDANLHGYYYSPQFINFNVTSFLNRSQENSGSGSITDASNVGASVGIFGGSHFPGAISFGKTFDSSSTYGVPGLPGYLTHGDGTSFGIGWGESIPGLPPLNATYSQGSGTSTAFGTSEQSTNETRSFTLGSSYRWNGWWTTGRFSDISSKVQIPEYLTNGAYSATDTNSKSFNFVTNHSLPMKGQASLGYSYGSFTGGGGGESTSGTNQSFTLNANFVPMKRVSSAFGLEYNTNLSGVVEQILTNAGSVSPSVNLGGQSHSLSFFNFENIHIVKNLDASFSFNRTEEEVYGQSVALDHFSAIVNYHFEKPLWGTFAVYGGVNDSADNGGNEGTGLMAGVNFGRTLLGFDWTGSFGYSQNVQTVVESVTSNYTYMASMRRNFGRHTTWNNSFSGYHTGLGQAEGSSAHSENLASTAGYRKFSVGANYGKSYGAALVTANGLVSAPTWITPVLNSNQYLLTNGTALGFTVSGSPVNKLSVNANFSKSQSSLTSPSLDTTSTSKTYTFFTQYQLRKVSLGAGYTKVMQGINTVGGVPSDFTSYYIGIQRWFNPF